MLKWNGKHQQKPGRKERVWLYEPDDVYKFGFYKEVMNANLEHDHRFTMKEDGFEFEYFVLSNWKYVAKCPVQIIKWFQENKKV